MSGKWGRPGTPTDKQRRAWDALHANNFNQLAAARSIGMAQGGVRQHILGYMKHMGIEGPIPVGERKRPGEVRGQMRFDLQTQRIRADAAEAEVARLREQVRVLLAKEHRRHRDGGPVISTRERRRVMVGTGNMGYQGTVVESSPGVYTLVTRSSTTPD